MRVVFDTNIFVSALAIPESLAWKAILKIIDGEDALLVSKPILDELLSTLANKFSRDPEELSRMAVNISEMSETVKPSVKVKTLKDDPDNRILECAVTGAADAIVTGDKAMLALKSFQGIRIISLREYPGR